MASGFLRAPLAKNLGQLISDWLAKHPEASVISASSMPLSITSAKGEMIWTWVVDRDGGTLNEYLVRQGACPGGTMILHKPEDIPEPLRSKMILKKMVSPEAYQRFVQKIAAAEKEAYENKRGIWRKGGEAQKR